MKKIILILTILFLIVTTTITKNSSKKLESQIFLIKENLSVLKSNYELIMLEYNYLSSPKKLLEYQSEYFEDDFTNIDINNIKMIKKENDILIISNFNKKYKNID